MASTIPGPPTMSDAVQPIPQITSFPNVNSFTLASFPFPGKWTLTEAKKEFGWQIQAGFGLSGAFVLPIGDKLVTAKFKGEFWSQSDFNLFSQLRKQLFKKPTFGAGVVSAAMGIDHPELKAMGVDGVVVLDYTPAIQEDGGLWTTTVTFLQYRPPTPAPKKPAFKVPSVSTSVTSAATAEESKAQSLFASAQAKAAKL